MGEKVLDLSQFVVSRWRKMNVPCINIGSVIQWFCIYGIVQRSFFISLNLLLPLFILLPIKHSLKKSDKSICSRNSFENNASLITPKLTVFFFFYFVNNSKDINFLTEILFMVIEAFAVIHIVNNKQRLRSA